MGMYVALKKSDNGFDKIIDEFKDKEKEASSTIKKEIDNSIIITPDSSKLVFKNYDDLPENKKIIKAQETVKRKLNLKMVHFNPQISNTDIKLKYGSNNLETITMYEQHYNSYIMALSDWAKLLIERGNFEDAENALITALEFNSDLSSTYTLLADIYYNTKNKAKLDNLRKIVLSSDINLKDNTLKYIDNLFKQKINER